MTLPAPLDDVDAALREHFGTSPLRAAVSFVGVESIEVLRFEPIPDERAYLSLGMSRHPMTSAAAEIQAADGPRAELMLHLRDGADEYADLWRQVAVLAAAPAVEGVVYVPDMTVDLGRPLSVAARCTGALVAQSPIAPVESTFGPVVVLQLLPATATELAWCRVHGAAALRERWSAQGIDLLDLSRGSVALE